jgi:HD-GYP domain-containing protein (c-di-GMP phosphodiesterase class II)
MDNFSSMKQENRDRAQEEFDSFIGASGFLAGRLFTPEGSLQATTEGKIGVPESNFYAEVRDVASTRQPYFSSAYLYNGRLASNLFIPVYPGHVLSETTPPSNILALVVPLQDMLLGFLNTSSNLDHQTALRLVQQTKGGDFQEIVAVAPDLMQVIDVKASFEGEGDIRFGQRENADGKYIYSAAAHLPAVGWWITTESDAQAVAEPIEQYRQMLTLVLVAGGLLTVFFIVSVVLFFSRHRHYKEEKSLLQELAGMRQTMVMKGRINQTLPMPICLFSAEEKTIIYANEPFAAMCGKPLAIIPGLGLSEVFNPEVANALQHGAQVLAISQNKSHSQVVELRRGSTSRFYEIVTLKCASEDNSSYDVQFMFREVTEERTRGEQDITRREQIIAALVRAVESRPSVCGHTALLRELCLGMGESLLLGDAQCATLEAAALLSQTGKIFVPREILLKKDTLTPEEVREAHCYFEHACGMIEDIDFDLPVVETLRQMQEAMDGSGYPSGLKGDEITMPGRVLGVANAFSSMVKNSSYRDAKTVSQALKELRQCPERYDAMVVRALEVVTLSASGQRMLRENGVELS